MVQNYVNEVKIPLGLDEFHIADFQETKTCFFIRLIPKKQSADCPHCRVLSFTVHSRRWQLIRDYPLYEKSAILRIWKRRFRCQHCLKTFTENYESISKRSHLTNRFAKALTQKPQRSFQEVAEQFGVHAKLVARTFKRQAIQRLNQRVLEPIAVLGIDENSFRKRLRYNLVLTDLARGKVIEILPGRSPKRIIEWLKRFPYRHLIRWVVTDLHRPFVQAVRAVCPDVTFVADRFHLIRNLNRHLCTVKEQGRREDPTLRYPRGLRWNLVMAREKLTGRQKKELRLVFHEYPPLATAYWLKERFRSLYRLKGFKKAQRALMDWIFMAEQSRLPKFQEFSRIVRRWEYPILDWFHFQITNGFTEGVNNKIKLIKRIGYGAMNFETLRLKILMSFN